MSLSVAAEYFNFKQLVLVSLVVFANADRTGPAKLRNRWAM
jgi:hypothetical protein